MDGGAWWAAVHGVAESRIGLSDFAFTFHFHSLEKEMAAHSSVLAWRIPGTGVPGGLPSMGSHRVGHDWSDLAAAAAAAAVGSCCAAQGTQPGALWKPREVGWGGRWDGASRGREHVEVYGWLMLMNGRSQQNTVKQLFSNFKKWI